jgi:hypothetical protein
MVVQAHEGRVNISSYYMVYEAKVVEASGCGPEDSEFESHHTPKKGKVHELVKMASLLRSESSKEDTRVRIPSFPLYGDIVYGLGREAYTFVKVVQLHLSLQRYTELRRES